MADISPANDAYRNAILATSEPRSVEGALMLRAAADLKAAFDRSETDYPAYIAALSKNLKLWTILSADAGHPRNRLPVDLRAAIIRLGAFVRSQTLRLQRGENCGVEILLEINRNMAGGLFQPRAPKGVE